MIRLATKEASKSSYRYKLGAVLVNKNGIIGTGFNKTNRYTRLFKQRFPGSLCAEQSAILDALSKHSHDKLIGSTLYVSRVAESGKLAMAKPCLACQAVIQSFQIKKVFYTTPTGTEVLEF